MIHWTCHICRAPLTTVHKGAQINGDRIDFCDPCDRKFRAWLAAEQAQAKAIAAKGSA